MPQNPVPVRQFLALRSSNCKRCGYLDESETTRFKCRTADDCPASELGLVVVGPAKTYAVQLLEARAKRDASLEASIMGKVAKRSKPFQSKFYSLLESLERDKCDAPPSGQARALKRK